MDTASTAFRSAWQALAEKELGPLGAQTELVCSELAGCSASLAGQDGHQALALFEGWIPWIYQLRSALNPLASDSDYLKAAREHAQKLVEGHHWWKIPAQMIWALPEIRIDPTRKMPPDGWNVNVAELDDVAAQYLRSDCVSPLLERILVSAYAYAEVEAFQFSIRARRLGISGALRAIAADSEPSPGWEMSKTIGLHVAGFLAKSAGLAFLGMLAFEIGGMPAAIISVAAFYALFSINGRLAPKLIQDGGKEIDKLLVDMSVVPNLVAKGETSPGHLLHLVKRSTNQGAVWPSMLWAVLQKSVERCPWGFVPRVSKQAREEAAWDSEFDDAL